MGERPWWAELLLGGIGAVVVPLAISVLWGRRWPVGAIAGIDAGNAGSVIAAAADPRPASVPTGLSGP